MSIIKKLFSRKHSEDKTPQSGTHRACSHSKLLDVSGENCGTSDEIDFIHELTDQLDQVLTEEGVGEYDGDEFGGGECVLIYVWPRRGYNP
jgi:hypothetical protein